MHAVSFAIRPGRVLGILGRTGSGKSTLTRLLFRLYDPARGAVRLGGADLRQVALADLRRRVGMVTQDVQLFQASVRENLVFFNPAVPQARLEEVLRALRLWEWVCALPQGLDTPLASGGGLSAGLTGYLSDRLPRDAFLFTEPSGAPSLKKSLEAGAVVTLPKVDNFVDGAAVARIGDLNFAALKDFSSEQVMLIPENAVCVTITEMLNVEGVVLEPAGALSIAALDRLGRETLEGKTVVAVVSGGNFDFERLPDVKERAMRYSGLKKYFILRLPQRPGALRDFLNLLGPDDDIARFEYLKKSARNFGSILIGIETRERRNFADLLARFEAAGLGYEDITENEILANLII